MKKSALFNMLMTTFCVALFLSIQSCKEGAVGPKGEDGNANVMQLTFGSKVHTGAEISFSLTGITQETLSKSAYFTYVNPGNAYWYSLPGTTSGGSKEYRTYVQSQAAATPLLYINRVAGTGSETFSSTRVIIIPASVLNNGRLNVDMNNYLEVKKAFNLPD